MAVRDYCWELSFAVIMYIKLFGCEILCCEQERSNHEDSYAVSV